MRPIAAELLSGTELYRRVILERLLAARASVLIATANVKEMYIGEGDGNNDDGGGAARRGGGRRGQARFRSILEVFDELAGRGVALRLLHADVPSRPFRAAFERKRRLTEGGLALKICPRVHFKAVIVDGRWVYLGSANLTGAGLGARDERRRNFEVGVCTEDFETIDRATALFEAVWSGAECGACKLRSVCPDPIGPATAAAAARSPRGARSLVTLGRARRIARPR